MRVLEPLSRRTALTIGAIVVGFIWSLTTHGKFSNSGDEPHYLMIAESILTDHDLDVANNYVNGSGEWFSQPKLEAGPHVRHTRSGASWSVHDIGVSIAVLPVYAFATRLAVYVPTAWLQRFHQTHGLFAYSIINLALAMLTALGAILMASALSRDSPRGAPAVVAIALALSPPVLSHSFLVFPEVFAFAATCLTVWLISRRDEELTRARVITVLAVLGCLPWFHRKYSFFALGLVFVLVRAHRHWFKRVGTAFLAAAAAVFLLPQVALHAWTIHAWGQLGGPQMLDALPFTAASLQTGAFGLLLDREFGLFSYGPIYLLAPVAFAVRWKRNWELLIPIALLYLPMAAFVEWRAGFSPAARYLTPTTPLLALAIGRVLDRALIRRLAAALAVFQVAISAYLWNHPRWLWPDRDSINHALIAIPVVGPLYNRFLPSMAATNAIEHAWIAFAAIAIASTLLAFVAKRSTNNEQLATNN